MRGGCQGEAGFVFLTNAKECRRDGGRALTDEEGLQVCCWIVCLVTLRHQHFGPCVEINGNYG